MKLITLILIVLIILSLVACGAGPAERQSHRDQMAEDFIRANPTCGEVGCSNSGCWCIRWVHVYEE